MVRDKYSLIVAGKEKAEIVYEDELFLAFVSEEAYAPGQITIIPKEKYTIFEMVPDAILTKLGAVVKLVSSAVFDSLKCHGTNVLIENGISAGQDVPYFSVVVLPRYQGDGLDFEWSGEEMEEFDLENAFLQLEAQVNGSASAVSAEHIGDDTVVNDDLDDMDDSDDKEDNYLVKSLNRMP